MTDQKGNKKFNWKSFISFGLFISFIIIASSGLVLYIAPQGRVAKWVNWQFLGLSKEMWQALHTNFTYTFLILSIFHIFALNWKVFLSYLKKKTGAGLPRKKELTVGVLLTAVVFLGTLFYIPPL
jgi:magnesium-transporting ATPase (P-type)